MVVLEVTSENVIASNLSICRVAGGIFLATSFDACRVVRGVIVVEIRYGSTVTQAGPRQSYAADETVGETHDF